MSLVQKQYGRWLFASHQCSGADGRVEARHVHVLTDARHHPHEELQLPAGSRGEEESAKLQGLDGHALTLRLENACTHKHSLNHFMVMEVFLFRNNKIKSLFAATSIHCCHDIIRLDR